jgi:hypothetical protein
MVLCKLQNVDFGQSTAQAGALRHSEPLVAALALGEGGGDFPFVRLWRNSARWALPLAGDPGPLMGLISPLVAVP